MNSPSKLKPALIAGLGLGAVSGIPFVNICCCVIAIGAGVLAAFLLSKDSKSVGATFGVGDGVIVGLLTAVFFTLAATVLATGFSLVMPSDPEQMFEMMEGMGLEIPDDARDGFGGGGEAVGMGMAVISGLIMYGLFGLIFCTLGGLLGGVLFKNEPQAPGEATPGV